MSTTIFVGHLATREARLGTAIDPHDYKVVSVVLFRSFQSRTNNQSQLGATDETMPSDRARKDAKKKRVFFFFCTTIGSSQQIDSCHCGRRTSFTPRKKKKKIDSHGSPSPRLLSSDLEGLGGFCVASPARLVATYSLRIDIVATSIKK
jgi:hypothetical protein